MTQLATDVARRLDGELARVVAGNETTRFTLLVALLAGGHLLIEGVPGTAKTLLVRTLARLIDVAFRRIAFTPDLMPADVTGTNVFDPRDASFAFRRGPLFANLVLADEINRTPPKTQSALLEAMEERKVSVDGERYDLPQPFLVCATQNPIEFEGTYPLPEAQLDRFLVRAVTGYPQPDQERALLARAVAGFDAADLASADVVPVADAQAIVDAQRAVRDVHVADGILAYLQRIVAATRTADELTLGASPRALLGLLRATQASAAIDGRAFATPDDVKAVAQAVLAHRIVMRPEAELDGLDTQTMVDRILAAVPAPAR